MDYLSYFPYKQSRPEQDAVLSQISENWSTKKYFILQLDVGTGKSGIAKCVANWCNSSYILTETKQLMEQYLRDFPDIVPIKGRSNYPCEKNPRFNCGNAPCTVRKVNCTGICRYLKQKVKAINSKSVIMPYAYMFTSVMNTTSRLGWSKRDLAVFDECHLLEQQLVSFAQFYISPTELDEKFGLFELESDEKKAVELSKPFVSNDLSKELPKLNRISELIHNKLDLLKSQLPESENIKGYDTADDESDLYKNLYKQYSELLDLSFKMSSFFESTNKSEWLINVDVQGSLVFSPIEVTGLFNKFCLNAADKYIFMSATILDTDGFIKELGINPDDALVIKGDSSFDPKKSPIYFMPCGSMTYSNIESSMPRVTQVISSILSSKKEKGIIHTSSYKIATDIYKKVNNRRLLMKVSESTKNSDLLKIHERSKNTVLLSPSMTTGVDLKDDLSRWQVVVKMPFGNMKDERIKAKSAKNWNWYVCDALRTMVQACGRSTRSKDDYSVTYVLDSSFKKWVTQYKNWLPKSFLDRIVWPD